VPPLLPEWRELQATLQSYLSRDKNAAARLDAALQKLSNADYADFLTGIERYRASPVVRDVPQRPVIWQKGTTRLFDYGEEGKKRPPVLVIPSLINRYHVLDLDEKQSLMRALAARFHPYLVDWDEPGGEELAFNLESYFTCRLLPVLAHVAAIHKKPVHLVGYCMGGTMAAALAQLMPDNTKSLSCLAAPWDFHAGDEQMPMKMQAVLTALDPLMESWGFLPVDLLQGFFISLQPFHLQEKFMRFAREPENSEAARTFVLVEDWVNEGVPLPLHVARACLQGWYIENQTARGNWRVRGETILPATLQLPNLHIIPQHDKIVPQASALGLATIMRQPAIIQPTFGHISMMVNAAARDKVWPQLFDWLASNS
jgi:polyhydroxyalkanoate synthase